MNKKLFHELLLKKKIKISFVKTINNYPYFIIPKIMYLNKLELNSNKFNNYLNKVALYMNERSYLNKIVENRTGSNEIVENFILTNPKIIIKKKNKNSDKDLSKSTTKVRNIITENLAKIYANQNKLDESITIYKKLMIKFPKKRTYFANKIKTLKK